MRYGSALHALYPVHALLAASADVSSFAFERIHDTRRGSERATEKQREGKGEKGTGGPNVGIVSF